MTEQDLSRNAARRLAIIRHAQEVTGNVARACRYYGFTRASYYKWLRRYEELEWTASATALTGLL